jgi:hypothetical protein
MSYNGHPSRNYWNVALWIGGDEGLYRHAISLCREYSKKRAAEIMAEEFDGQKTPDGAPYTKAAILHALRGL